MLHSFSLVDVLGASHVVTPDMVFITATDKFLSGWGCASGLISKRIVKYGVFIIPFPHIPPFFGSLAQCIKAAQVADRHAAELLEK